MMAHQATERLEDMDAAKFQERLEATDAAKSPERILP